MCEIIGTDIMYHWMKDNISLPDTSSNRLKIMNTMESDEGVYKCVASNNGGIVESNPATVTVYGEHHEVLIINSRYQLEKVWLSKCT